MSNKHCRCILLIDAWYFAPLHRCIAHTVPILCSDWFAFGISCRHMTLLQRVMSLHFIVHSSHCACTHAHWFGSVYQKHTHLQIDFLYSQVVNFFWCKISGGKYLSIGDRARDRSQHMRAHATMWYSIWACAYLSFTTTHSSGRTRKLRHLPNWTAAKE